MHKPIYIVARSFCCTHTRSEGEINEYILCIKSNLLHGSVTLGALSFYAIHERSRGNTTICHKLHYTMLSAICCWFAENLNTSVISVYINVVIRFFLQNKFGVISLKSWMNKNVIIVITRKQKIRFMKCFIWL